MVGVGAVRQVDNGVDGGSALGDLDEIVDGLAVLVAAESPVVAIGLAQSGRLDSDHYGICVACVNEIQQERLEALPATPVCVSCARGGC